MTSFFKILNIVAGAGAPRLQAQSICFKIQCDQYLQTAAKDATGERAAGLQSMASTLTGQGITVSNIVDYMSLIEQRSVQASTVASVIRSLPK